MDNLDTVCGRNKHEPNGVHESESELCCHFVPLRPPGMNTVPVRSNINVRSPFCDQRGSHVICDFVFDHDSYLLVNYPEVDTLDTVCGRNMHELIIVHETKSELFLHYVPLRSGAMNTTE